MTIWFELCLKSRLVTIRFSSIFTQTMVPYRFIQYSKDHIWRYLVLRWIRFRFVEHPHAILSQHLKTSEEGWMSIKTSTRAKAGNRDDGHLQPGILAQGANGKGIANTQRPFVGGIEGGWKHDNGISSREHIWLFRTLVFASHGIAGKLLDQGDIEKLCALGGRDDAHLPRSCLCLHDKIWNECRRGCCTGNNVQHSSSGGDRFAMQSLDTLPAE